MLRTASTLTLGFLVLLTGCPGDDSATSGASADSTSTSTGSTTADPSTSSADTTEGPATTAMTGSTTNTTVPGTTTDEPGTTTDEPGSTTDEPGTTTGSSEACEPAPADDDCAMCVKDMCCDQLAACQADANCVCFQECAQKNPGIGGAIQCGMTCGDSPAQAGTPTGDLGACTQTNCGFGICI